MAARILRFAEEKGTITATEIRGLGSSRQYASQLVKQGRLRRVRFGVYAVVSTDTLLDTDNHYQ